MEKVLLKVSGIIAIILGILYCFTIIGILWGIPLIIGGSTMIGYSNQSNKEIIEKKNSILCWSIFFLFFTVIGGILGLMFYFTMDDDKKIFNFNSNNNKNDYIDEIRKLDELRKNGIITEEEYEAKKKKILDI
jgi:membrane-bound ClpP family serine protease